MTLVVVAPVFGRLRVVGPLMLLGIGAPLAAQQFGRVSGTVVATEARLPLVGAQVVVQGTSYGAVTDDNGRFVIGRVPVGPQVLRVSHLGRRPTTREIVVAAGNNPPVEFVLEPLELATILVQGVRAKTQAEALSRQQNAPNITNVVAADQMGRFPDASAPEAVQRLPGVAVQRDQGEGRYIQMRGGSAANTQVSVNGEQVPSPEGAVRQIALDAVPVGVLEAIEVAKAITPDMDADAIGGAVNLVTKKAPNVRLFSVEGAGGYESIREDWSGRGAFTYGSRTSDEKLGYLLSGSYSRRNFGSDDLEPDYDLGDVGLADDALAELEVRHYTLWRSRAGATASLDYRLGQGSSIVLTGLYSEMQDEEQRRRVMHVVEDDELEFRHKNRLEKLRTVNVGLVGEHLSVRGIKFDWRATYTQSQEDTPYDTEVFFLQSATFSPSLADPERPQANPQAGAINGPFPFSEIQPASSITKNGDWVGAVNLSLPYNLGAVTSGTLRFGVKYRDKKKDQNVTETEYELAAGETDIILGTDVGQEVLSNDNYNPGAYPLPPRVTSPGDVTGFLSRFGSRLEGGDIVLEAETNDYLLNERITGVYVMSEMNLTPSVMLMPGVRYERTDFDADAFAFDTETEVLSPTRAEKSYSNVFPMVHLRYRIGSQTNLRAAFTTAIARPDFEDLVPFRVVDAEDISLGNPQLEPTTSRNYDLLIERYDRRVGVMSAGVFYKQLRNPIFDIVTDNALGGETEQPGNTPTGRIYGVELAFQQQLSYLPRPFDGLGIYLNYTRANSKADLSTGETTRIAGQADQVFNAALSYEKRGFTGQISANYTGSYLDELGDNREEDIFIDDRFQLDLSMGLFVTPAAQVFLEAVNLTNAPHRTYAGNEIRLRQKEFYEPSILLGLRYRP